MKKRRVCFYMLVITSIAPLIIHHTCLKITKSHTQKLRSETKSGRGRDKLPNLGREQFSGIPSEVTEDNSSSNTTFTTGSKVRESTSSMQNSAYSYIEDDGSQITNDGLMAASPKVQIETSRPRKPGMKIVPKIQMPLGDYPTPLDPDDWQEVLQDQIYVYSAHLDPWVTGKNSTIRIPGTMVDTLFLDPSARPRLSCKVWEVGSGSRVNVHTAPVFVNETQRYWNDTYRDIEYICWLPVDRSRLSTSIVQMVTEDNSQSHNSMILHHNYDKGLQYNVTLCLWRALYGNLSTSWFVEWMEANLMFGAEKILIHNMSIPRHLDPYLDYYSRLDLLELLPWSLGDDKLQRSHCHLQQVMVSDCQYRLQRFTKYLVGIDIDELIVPRHPDDTTWMEMIHRVETQQISDNLGGRYEKHCPMSEEQHHSYGARHMWFMKDEAEPDPEPDQLFSNTRTVRRSGINHYRLRGKYIANTYKTRFHTVHYVESGEENTTRCVMDYNIGSLHHYRNDNLRPTDEKTNDYNMWRFTDRLRHRISTVVNIVENSSRQE